MVSKQSHAEGTEEEKYSKTTVSELSSDTMFLTPPEMLDASGDAIPVENVPSTAREARAQGTRYFWTGKPCVRGHFDVRYAVNGCCRTCTCLRNPDHGPVTPDFNVRRSEGYEHLPRYIQILEDARVEKRWSMATLSKLAGLTRSYWQNMCQTGREPSFIKYASLARVLGVSVKVNQVEITEKKHAKTIQSSEEVERRARRTAIRGQGETSSQHDA